MATRTGKRSGKSASSRSSSRRGSGKRDLIAPRGDKRYVRRNGRGQFSESDDVGRSLSRDVKQHAMTRSRRGEGDRGDRG